MTRKQPDNREFMAAQELAVEAAKLNARIFVPEKGRVVLVIEQEAVFFAFDGRGDYRPIQTRMPEIAKRPELWPASGN